METCCMRSRATLHRARTARDRGHAFGAVESIVGIVRIRMRTAVRELVWLKFARWLVAGMTFQLAADLVSTSFDPSAGIRSATWPRSRPSARS